MPNDNKQILLVDDETLILMMLEASLEAVGFDNILEASHFSAASRLIREHQSTLGLVVTDLQYDEGGGLALIKYIRSLNLPIPIIVITGSVSKWQEAVARDPGLVNIPVFFKPLHMDVFLEKVREVLEVPGRDTFRGAPDHLQTHGIGSS